MKLTCNICDSTNTTKLGTIEGYRTDTYFDVIGCNDCESNFVYPCEPDDTIYEAIYKNVSAIPGYSRYAEYAQQILKEKKPLNYLINSDDCYFGIIKTVLEEVNKNPKNHLILEIGCGQGYLTYALTQSGINAIGLDLSATAIDLAKQRYGNHYFCEDAKSHFERTKNRPSIIILSEVIEHIKNPYYLLTELLSYLQPNGAIIVTTPNKDSCRTDGIWETELPPVHLWWLTAKGLITLGNRLSCKTEFADLDKFYQDNKRFTSAAKTKSQQRVPILDKEYCVITPMNQRTPTLKSSITRLIKHIISRKLLHLIQLKKAKEQGLVEISASNPASLCVKYKAVKP